MCWQCDTYEYSRSCGVRCSDHAYGVDAELSDSEGAFYRCPRCGSVKFVEEGE